MTRSIVDADAKGDRYSGEGWCGAENDYECGCGMEVLWTGTPRNEETEGESENGSRGLMSLGQLSVLYSAISATYSALSPAPRLGLSQAKIGPEGDSCLGRRHSQSVSEMRMEVLPSTPHRIEDNPICPYHHV